MLIVLTFYERLFNVSRIINAIIQKVKSVTNFLGYIFLAEYMLKEFGKYEQPLSFCFVLDAS